MKPTLLFCRLFVSLLMTFFRDFFSSKTKLRSSSKSIFRCYRKEIPPTDLLSGTHTRMNQAINWRDPVNEIGLCVCHMRQFLQASRRAENFISSEEALVSSPAGKRRRPIALEIRITRIVQRIGNRAAFGTRTPRRSPHFNRVKLANAVSLDFSHKWHSDFFKTRTPAPVPES